MRKSNANGECIGIGNDDGFVRFYSHAQQKFVSDSFQLTNAKLESSSWSSSIGGMQITFYEYR